MKKIIYSILIGGLFLSSCQENEMVKFDNNDRINFMADYRWAGEIGSNPIWSDMEDYLNYEVNFGISKQGETMLYDTLEIGVKIMGRVTDYPRKVKFMLDAPERNALQVVFPEEYYVPADTIRSSFKILIKRPEKRGIKYTANLIFDYANSDFAAGTVERQVLPLTAWDSVSIKLWNAFSWENNKSKLGEYSNQKARFIITYYGCLDFDTWYTSSKGTKLPKDLEAYKAECEVNSGYPEFLEENGQWITFP